MFDTLSLPSSTLGENPLIVVSAVVAYGTALEGLHVKGLVPNPQYLLGGCLLEVRPSERALGNALYDLRHWTLVGPSVGFHSYTLLMECAVLPQAHSLGLASLDPDLHNKPKPTFPFKNLIVSHILLD